MADVIHPEVIELLGRINAKRDYVVSLVVFDDGSWSIRCGDSRFAGGHNCDSIIPALRRMAGPTKEEALAAVELLCPSSIAPPYIRSAAASLCEYIKGTED